jgi:hypothetical protein
LAVFQQFANVLIPIFAKRTFFMDKEQYQAFMKHVVYQSEQLAKQTRYMKEINTAILIWIGLTVLGVFAGIFGLLSH